MRGPSDVSELVARTIENLGSRCTLSKGTLPRRSHIASIHIFFFFFFLINVNYAILNTLELACSRFKTVRCSISRAKYKETIILSSALGALGTQIAINEIYICGIHYRKWKRATNASHKHIRSLSHARSPFFRAP